MTLTATVSYNTTTFSAPVMGVDKHLFQNYLKNGAGVMPHHAVWEMFEMGTPPVCEGRELSIVLYAANRMGVGISLSS